MGEPQHDCWKGVNKGLGVLQSSGSQKGRPAASLINFALMQKSFGKATPVILPQNPQTPKRVWSQKVTICKVTENGVVKHDVEFGLPSKGDPFDELVRKCITEAVGKLPT